MTLKTGYIQIGLCDYKTALKVRLAQIEEAARVYEQREEERLSRMALDVPAIKETFRSIFNFAMGDYRDREKSFLRPKVKAPTIDSANLRVVIDRRQYNELQATFTAMISGANYDFNRYSDSIAFTYDPPQIRVDHTRTSLINDLTIQLATYPDAGLIEITVKEAEGLNIPFDATEVIYR